jgi:hypothetical protein
VDLATCLEALLAPEEECISYKLGLRVANLIGADAASRKELFKKVRSFYSLRSKMVHGVPIEKLKQREQQSAQELDALREIARRVLLSAMAAASEIGLGTEFYSLLDEACLDDNARNSVQISASKLLHC